MLQHHSGPIARGSPCKTVSGITVDDVASCPLVHARSLRRNNLLLEVRLLPNSSLYYMDMSWRRYCSQAQALQLRTPPVSRWETAPCGLFRLRVAQTQGMTVA